MENKKKYETPLHYMMAFVGGFFGVYAILSFCDLFGNAQTANMIYFVTDLLGHDFADACLRLGGVLLFMAAIALTVWLPRHSSINLQVASIFLDGAAAVLIGLFPMDIHPVLALYPFFFATAFQWNSFKGAKGFASSTLFSTNNLKQFTMAVTEVFLNKDKTHTVKARFFGCTLLSFHVGVACSFAARSLIGPRSIWCALLPLGIALYTVCLANEWLPLAVAEGAKEQG